MMSASEGGMEKQRSKGGCVNFILQISSKEEGEGIKKAENIADVINGCSLTMSAFPQPLSPPSDVDIIFGSSPAPAALTDGKACL